MIGRRSFLAGILGAAAAPAIVKADSLMKIVVPRPGLYTGELGVIDAEFRFVASDPINQRLAHRMTREMLSRLESRLLLEAFKRPRPILQSSPLATLRFRRHVGEPIFLPSTPLHDLLHGDRKTA